MDTPLPLAVRPRDENEGVSVFSCDTVLPCFSSGSSFRELVFSPHPSPPLILVLLLRFSRSLDATLNEGKIDLEVVDVDDDEETLEEEKDEEVEVEVEVYCGLGVVVVVVVVDLGRAEVVSGTGLVVEAKGVSSTCKRVKV